jgi:hypothetical protein
MSESLIFGIPGFHGLYRMRLGVGIFIHSGMALLGVLETQLGFRLDFSFLSAALGEKSVAVLRFFDELGVYAAIH